MESKEPYNPGRSIMNMGLALLIVYVVLIIVCYIKWPNPLGFWHFLTRGKGWIDDDMPGSGMLHFLTPHKN